MPSFLESPERLQIVVMVCGLVLFAAWETFRPFFDFFRSAPRERGWHLARNLALGAINSVAIAIVFVALWVWAASFAEARGVGLLNWLSRIAALPLWGHAIGAILLFDLWTYVWHRLNHRVPFLWRFHRVHHADARMDVSTASRFHVGEIVLSSLLRVPLIVLIGAHVWELLIYETMMFAVVQFHHANIGIHPVADKALRAFIVTPAMHKVHHSRLRRETDSNYSAFFSFWDRIAQTFRLRPDPHTIHFGLEEFDDPRHDSVGGMLKMPLLDQDRTERT